MNPRDNKKKKYESALSAYQEQIGEIAILEQELTRLGEKRPNTPQETFDALKERIKDEYQKLQVLAQNVTDTYKEYEESEEPVSENVEDLNEAYFEVLDRYEDQLEHIEHLEQELADLGEKTPHASEEEMKAKRQEIEEAYKSLAVLTKDLNKAINPVDDDKMHDSEQLLKEITDQIDEVINAIDLDDKKEEDENVSHEEPENTPEPQEENKKGLGFDELNRYIEGYLYMKGASDEKVHTEVTEPYEDQRNISITLNLDSGYTYHYDSAQNPKNGEKYSYMCWIAHKKDNKHIAPEEFKKSADEWADECDHVFQLRGANIAGIQVQELVTKEDGKLHPLYVYETKDDKIVKGVVGENELKEVSLATMIIDLDEKLNSVIKEEKQDEVTEVDEFEEEKAEIARLEAENKELTRQRNENEKRKILLMTEDNAKLENLSGYDEAIRQLNQQIKNNNEFIAELKAKHPEYYKEEEVLPVVETGEEERATKEDIREAIEEALANVQREHNVENIKEQEKLNEPEVDDTEYEDIFEGTFIPNGLMLSEEEKREKVYNLMKQAGLDLTDQEKESLVITYSDVDNDKVKFTVKRPIVKTYQETVETVNTETDEKDYIKTMTPEGVQLVEKITLYVDLDNSDVYGKNYLFKRFNMEKQSDKVVIDGFNCYKMDEDYVDYIVRNQNNNYSPYVVETREVHMGKKQEPENEPVVENNPAPVVEQEKEQEQEPEIKTEEVDEKTIELADEMRTTEKYMTILHPEYKDINKLDKDLQRSLLMDYWYIRDNYKDIDNVFTKMQNYYSGADIDEKSLLMSILPKYVIEQEMQRRKEHDEMFISEAEYKDAIYKALANKDRYMPDWSYIDTMLSEISDVNTRNVILSQNNIEINKEFKVTKPEIIMPEQTNKLIYQKEISSLEEIKDRINSVLVDYQSGLSTSEEAIQSLATIFQENTNAINYSLETLENKEKVRRALMNIINDRNCLYEMCGILIGELTENDQIQYLDLEDAFKITDLDDDVLDDITTYLMSTLLIQQTESQIIVDNKVADYIGKKRRVR